MVTCESPLNSDQLEKELFGGKNDGDLFQDITILGPHPGPPT